MPLHPYAGTNDKPVRRVDALHPQIKIGGLAWGGACGGRCRCRRKEKGLVICVCKVLLDRSKTITNPVGHLVGMGINIPWRHCVWGTILQDLLVRTHTKISRKSVEQPFGGLRKISILRLCVCERHVQGFLVFEAHPPRAATAFSTMDLSTGGVLSAIAFCVSDKKNRDLSSKCSSKLFFKIRMQMKLYPDLNQPLTKHHRNLPTVDTRETYQPLKFSLANPLFDLT